MPVNPFSLKEKTILITGASSGIGRQIAIQCSRMEAQLIISGRNSDRLAETLSMMEGNHHTLISADIVTQQDDILSNLPPLHGFVNAAGILELQPFQFLAEESFRNIFEVNLFAPSMLLQKMMKKKLIQKNGSVVFISSLAGNVIVSKGNSAYSSSKSALTAIAKTLALEYSARPVRVNSILPGMVKTEMMENFLQNLTPEQLAEDEKKYPLGYGNPEDVAFAAIYLLSDASRWITGSSLVLDGGFSIQ